MEEKEIRKGRWGFAGCSIVGNDSERHYMILEIVLLVLNICFIIAIFIVAVMWYATRSKPLTDMMPAPNKDRSICIGFNEDKSCRGRELPENYIADQVDKNMRRLQMQYMAEKLNYANVVCRKSSPSIYLFSGIERFISKENVRWRKNMVKVPSEKQNISVNYNFESGKFTVNKDGMYFIYSQITEKALNLRSNGTSFQIVIQRNGQSMPVLESESTPCLLVSAKGKKAHYVGSAYQLLQNDLVYATHSNPAEIINTKDTFMGIRELW